MASPVVFPACPAKEPRLRITATSMLDKDTVIKFRKCLIEASENTEFRDPEIVSLL